MHEHVLVNGNAPFLSDRENPFIFMETSYKRQITYHAVIDMRTFLYVISTEKGENPQPCIPTTQVFPSNRGIPRAEERETPRLSFYYVLRLLLSSFSLHIVLFLSSLWRRTLLAWGRSFPVSPIIRASSRVQISGDHNGPESLDRQTPS